MSLTIFDQTTTTDYAPLNTVIDGDRDYYDDSLSAAPDMGYWSWVALGLGGLALYWALRVTPEDLRHSYGSRQTGAW
jgi:hypothetical protein